MVVVAVGLSPNPLIPFSYQRPLKTDKWGELKIDENFMTTLPGVFAGGDIVGGETVIQPWAWANAQQELLRNILILPRVSE